MANKNKKRGRKPEPKQKLQFSQKMTVLSAAFSMFIVLFVHVMNFWLLANDKFGMPQETVATVTTYGAILSGLSLAGYYTLQAVRDCSKNKNGITQIELGLIPDGYTEEVMLHGYNDGYHEYNGGP